MRWVAMQSAAHRTGTAHSTQLRRATGAAAISTVCRSPRGLWCATYGLLPQQFEHTPTFGTPPPRPTSSTLSTTRQKVSRGASCGTWATGTGQAARSIILEA